MQCPQVQNYYKEVSRTKLINTIQSSPYPLMTDYHSIRCPVCLHPFDAAQHIPKVFPMCGHTICQECLAQVLKTDEPKCPMDKLKFGREFRKVNAFPTNFLGKELLEMKRRWNSCGLHHEDKEFVCLDDNTLVCYQCVIFGDHKCHQVKRLSEYQLNAKIKKDELQGLANKISKSLDDLNTSIEEEQKRIKSIIKKRFEALHIDLQRHEADMQGRVTTYFTNKRSAIMKLTGDSAGIKKIIENKLREFNDIMSNPNIVQLVQEDFSDISKQIDEKLICPSHKSIKELDELSAPVLKSLPPQDFAKGLNVLEKLDQELQLLKVKPLLAVQELANNAIHVESVELDINIGMFSQIMNIQSSNVEKSYTFKASELSKIRGLSYKISPDRNIFNETVVNELSNLVKHIIDTESVSIELHNSSEQAAQIDQNLFLSLVSASFTFPKNIKHIYFNVKNTTIGDLAPLFIIEKVLPRIKDLKSFYFISQNSGITTSVLKALAKEELSKKFTLEKFRLQISGAILEEQDVVQFLSQTHNVKDLSLRFESTAVTDQWLDSFSVQILPSLDKVQRLEIGLSNTNITDEGIKRLLINLPNAVTNLLIGLEQTKITNTGLQEFLDTKVSTLTNLRDLDLNILNTNTSNDMPDLIRKARQKVISGVLAPSDSFAGFFGKTLAFAK